MNDPFLDYADEIIRFASKTREVNMEIPLTGRMILPIQQNYLPGFHSIGRVGLPLLKNLGDFLRVTFSDSTGQPCVRLHSEPNFDHGFLIWVRPFLAFGSGQESIAFLKSLAERGLAHLLPSAAPVNRAA